jgi:hypothetical protein
MSIGIAAKFFSNERLLVQAIVRPRQDILQVVIVGFDSLHRIVDGFADVGTLRQLQQVREPCGFRQVQDSTGLIIRLPNRSPPTALTGELGLGLSELVIGVSQEDEAKDRDGIFGGFQLRVGPKFISGAPQAFFKFGMVRWHGRWRGSDVVASRTMRGYCTSCQFCIDDAARRQRKSSHGEGEMRNAQAGQKIWTEGRMLATLVAVARCQGLGRSRDLGR